MTPDCEPASPRSWGGVPSVCSSVRSKEGLFVRHATVIAAFLAGVVLPIGGCAHALHSASDPARVPDAEAVIATTQTFFDALAARDEAALRSVVHPEVHVAVVGPDGSVDIAYRGVDEVVRPTIEGPAVREEMFDPRVEVSERLASLWAPYDFYVDGQFSHCGIDNFNFVRVGDRWQMISAIFSVKAEGGSGGK